MKKFGDEIKKLRKDKNISIRKLGELSGISHAYISQIENGKRGNPKPDLIKKLAKALDVRYVDLLIKAGHLPEMDENKKKRIEDSEHENEKFRSNLGEELEKALRILSDGNLFKKEVDDRIQLLVLDFDELPRDTYLAPALLRKYVEKIDWDTEWLQDLVSMIVHISQAYLEGEYTQQENDLLKILDNPNLQLDTYHLTEEDRTRIKDMIKVLFPNIK